MCMQTFMYVYTKELNSEIFLLLLSTEKRSLPETLPAFRSVFFFNLSNIWKMLGGTK